MSGARSDRRRLAIVGIGHVAEHQLQALATSSCWELVGAADVRAERRELLSPGLPCFGSAAELLREVQADMVLVSTPNRTHFELGKLVLEAGRNLLLEKPCCETPGQLEELIGTAQRTGALFSVALHAAHARDLRWFVEHRASLQNATRYRSGLVFVEFARACLRFASKEDEELAASLERIESQVQALGSYGFLSRVARVVCGVDAFSAVAQAYDWLDLPRFEAGVARLSGTLQHVRETIR